jgi:hypothetical protein
LEPARLRDENDNAERDSDPAANRGAADIPVEVVANCHIGVLGLTRERDKPPVGAAAIKLI